MSITSDEIIAQPPQDLPTNPAEFWGTPPGELFKPLDVASANMPVIDQLGSAPFKKPDKGGFPFLGFLASVYEHVSTTAMAELHSLPTTADSSDPSSPPPTDANTTGPALEINADSSTDDADSMSA